MPAALACGVLGNGLSPISSSTTSFPSALRFRARTSTVNAVSAVKFSARVLSRGMHGFLPQFLERFSDALHAPRLSPPLPPLRKGGRVGGVWSFFPPLRRGDTGGFFECLCVAPGLASRRLKIALADFLLRRNTLFTELYSCCTLGGQSRHRPCAWPGKKPAWGLCSGAAADQGRGFLTRAGTRVHVGIVFLGCESRGLG